MLNIRFKLLEKIVSEKVVLFNSGLNGYLLFRYKIKSVQKKVRVMIAQNALFKHAKVTLFICFHDTTFYTQNISLPYKSFFLYNKDAQ
jgi:hypothetical protein